ncbi:hypothetical protein V490_06595 [Pseudogymnoascus sp. VKM F-3557]|nr:hypothetical protein V490_06595 [Pseudogymnoascus sp. VKM F-3557]
MWMDLWRRLQGLAINSKDDPDGEDSPEICGRLAIQEYEQFLRSESKAALDNAVKFGYKSIRTACSSDKLLPDRLSNLSCMLCGRYELANMIEDLDDAIMISTQAFESIPHSPELLSNMSRMYELRCWRKDNPADLEESIKLARLATTLTPSANLSKAGLLSNLGDRLHSRYKLANGIADLEEAIGVTRQAVNSTRDRDDNWATYFYNLSRQLISRYERTGEIVDLEEAVRIARLSVNSGSQNFYSQAAMLDSLGDILTTRHIRTRDVTDINEAIEVTREAVDTTPPAHARRWTYLNSLGNRLRHRYERTGEMTDLEVAVTVIRQAVSLWPSNQADQPTLLIGLGGHLIRRYELTGLLLDIDEAIVAMRKAIDSTTLTGSAKANALTCLGSALGLRYERTAVMADIEDAIKATREALDFPQRRDERSSTLTTLGNVLFRRYGQKRDVANLEEAITVTRQAVDSIPHDDFARLKHLSSLGVMLRSKFEQTAKTTDLEEAIMVARQGVNATQEDDPNKLVYLYNLSNKLGRQYYETHNRAHLDEAASRCLLLLPLQGKLGIARQLGKDIIDLLPTVNTKLLDRADQQFVVSEFSGVAANTCASLLEVNQSSDALYYLEKGRAVIIGQLVDARSDLSTLVHQYPDLARRYEQLRKEVNTPATELNQDRAGIWDSRCMAIADLDACVTEIRNTPGQERFLLGQTTAEMQECAAGGTIVIVNIAIRSDAIIVSTEGIQVLNLPKLLYGDAKGWLDRKWTGRRGERAQKNKEYLEYLSWLWEVCVKQVLDEVDNSHGTAYGLPRIWWIGTGLASSMPFHAAGKHFTGSTENALSRAISSYTPSIKALGYSRYRARAADPKGGTLLITTMPTTPGNDQGLGQNSHKPPRLPGVKEEKVQVTGVAGSHLKVESLDHPSVGQVIDRLENCYIAHFACHGYTDHSDPSNSGLILQKRVEGQDEQDRLTVRKVSELRLEKAQVAYLSACSTAENISERLQDEVIHVVSGFQMAGFPHVVGCLWPSIDSVCVEVASEFYSLMLGNGGEGLVRKGGVASALRDAVLKVRAENMGSPLLLRSEDPVLKEMLNGPSTACSVIPSLSKPSSTQAPKVRPRCIRIAVGVSFVWTQRASPRLNRHLRHTHDLDRLSDREENIPGSPRDLYRLGYIAEAGLLSRSPIAIDLINKNK